MNATNILTDPQNFPWRFDPENNRVEFAHMTRDDIAQSPFLDHRSPGHEAAKSYASVDAFIGAQRTATKTKPPAYIFHVAFCASTLIARCLDMPGRALALKEPFCMVSLAHAKARANASGRALHPEFFKSLNGLLARPFSGNERAVIKPSNGANNLLVDALEQPNVKVILLYTDIRKFLLSVAKRGQQGFVFARNLLHVPWGNDPRIAKIGKQDALTMTDLQSAALVWQLQVDSFSRALSKFPSSQVRALDAADFEKNPMRTLNAIDSFFELELGEQRIEDVVGSPLLGKDAKFVDKVFNAEAQAQITRDLEIQLGKDLDNVIAWAEKQPFSSERMKNSSLLAS